MGSARLKVAWISFFPLEWLPDIPEPLTKLSRPHPASWQRVLLEELQTRPELELHVVYVRRHFERSFSFERQGVWFHCLKVPRGMRELSLFWWETFLIRRCLRRVQPDLVQAWGTDRGAAMVATRLGYPCLVTMQGLINWIAESVPLNAAQKVQAWLEKVSLRRARLATAESAFAVRWLRQHYPNLEVLQVEHAPGWIFHRVERRPELKPLRLLFVGVPGLLKGTDLLVRALDALRAELDFRLTLVGPLESAMKQQLQAATSSALWERVELRQDLSPAEVAAEMARAALLVFPTRVDNSPNAVKEAVVTGVPVVASAVGGIVDYVIPGQNGLTFAPGDLSQLVQTIRAAAGHPQFSKGQVDPATLRQMREYLSPATMRDKFLAAYQHALEV